MWETHRDEWEEEDRNRLWAAGLFEGEGCLTISGTKHPQARMMLRMTDRDVVEEFASIMPAGNFREERGQLRRGHKLQYEWYTGKQDDVMLCIDFLKPYLGQRRTARAIELERHIMQLQGHI